VEQVLELVFLYFCVFKSASQIMQLAVSFVAGKMTVLMKTLQCYKCYTSFAFLNSLDKGHKMNTVGGGCVCIFHLQN
jgi:hypothetical protein